MGVEAVEALAASCQSHIEEFYDRIAARTSRPGAVYFAEKFWSPSIPELLWELYPGAREIVLVRDFRDFACSIFAYNRKTGGRAFRRESSEKELSYILETLRPWAFSLMNSWKRRSDHTHLLRYEDLILRPRETLAGLFAYLDLELAETQLDLMLQRLFAKTPAAAQHRTSGGADDSIGRWRHDLTPELQKACEEAFAPALEAFGYSVGNGVEREAGESVYTRDSEPR
jgi:hypothetical protein